MQPIPLKHKQRNQKMTPDQKSRVERLANIASSETMAAERHLKKAIRRYSSLIDIADEIAGDDRTGTFAKAALRLRSIQEQYKASLALMQSAHCDASILECEILGRSMTRGGER